MIRALGHRTLEDALLYLQKMTWKQIHKPDTHLGFGVSGRADGRSKSCGVYKTLNESPSNEVVMVKTALDKRDVDQVTRQGDVTK